MDHANDTPRRPVGGLAAGALAAVVAVLAVSRCARLGTWGATAEEAAASMPGDELLAQARYRTTRAVSIAAPAGEVWPWLVQMGQGRGGLYSYDWLENLVGLDMHSADHLVPELQGLAVGDTVRLTPEGMEPALRFTVRRLDPAEVLVLGPDGSPEEAFAAGLPYPVWTFQLRPRGEHGCRLVVRFQSDFPPTVPSRLANRYALAPVHFAMERRMLLGIRERAEARPGRGGAGSASGAGSGSVGRG